MRCRSGKARWKTKMVSAAASAAAAPPRRPEQIGPLVLAPASRVRVTTTNSALEVHRRPQQKSCAHEGSNCGSRTKTKWIVELQLRRSLVFSGPAWSLVRRKPKFTGAGSADIDGARIRQVVPPITSHLAGFVQYPRVILWQMEGEAMSLMTLSLDAVRRPPKWRQLRAELRQRAHSRDEPDFLDDYPLSDVGLTQVDADHAADNPFWPG